MQNEECRIMNDECAAQPLSFVSGPLSVPLSARSVSFCSILLPLPAAKKNCHPRAVVFAAGRDLSDRKPSCNKRRLTADGPSAGACSGKTHPQDGCHRFGGEAEKG